MKWYFLKLSSIPDDLLLDVELAPGHLAEVRPGRLGKLHNALHLEVEALAHQVGWDIVKLALHREPEENLKKENMYSFYINVIF